LHSNDFLPMRSSFLRGGRGGVYTLCPRPSRSPLSEPPQLQGLRGRPWGTGTPWCWDAQVPAIAQDGTPAPDSRSSGSLPSKVLIPLRDTTEGMRRAGGLPPLARDAAVAPCGCCAGVQVWGDTGRGRGHGGLCLPVPNRCEQTRVRFPRPPGEYC